MTAKKLLSEANLIKGEMITHRRYLHANAEVGFDLTNTVQYVKNELIKLGYEPTECGKAGLVATVGKKAGKTFMLRADMDALPIEEKSGVEFSSKNGNMHACGHDMHTAMLLGTAKLLKQHESEINGTIMLMFQPAEEIFEGSADMIKSGLLQNPTVDAAIMIHVMAGMPFEVGTAIVSSEGVSAPAADYFEIRVQGKGCHGSMPNTGVDPLNVASHILIALQEINARELAMGERAVLTIGTMHSGTAPNAIPDNAVMGGSIRTFDEETRSFVKQRMTEIATGIAISFRTTAEIVFGSGCPSLLNNGELSKSVERYATELLGANKVFNTAKLSAVSGNDSKTAGSEDFAYISREVPSVMLALAAGQPKNGYSYPQHHPMVKFDETALISGCAVYAYLAMRWLEEN